MISAAWDYLIVTASNEEQASAYRSRLELRTRLGFIPGVKHVLAVSDPGGRRVGSGGSTIHCLIQILNMELESRGGGGGAGGGSKLITDRAAWLEALSRLRILIIHAGGDSRRLPAYGPCGKVFIPLPGESDRALGMTLLDRILPTYISLPPGASGQGQIVVSSGDVLLTFDRRAVRFAGEGITALGCFVPPELAANHGVICPDEEGRVRLFLQKPSAAEQRARGAINRRGQSVLDIGIMSFDARTALELLDLCGTEPGPSGGIGWTGSIAAAIEERSLDFYREISCALGTEARFEDYVRSVRGSGSKLEDVHLRRIFDALSGIPFFVSALPQCAFLHFGTSRQLIRSGNDLLSMDGCVSPAHSCLSINNDIAGDGQIAGANSWVEGCRIEAPLALDGENLITGVDVRSPLTLPGKSVLDVLKGKDKEGREAWFVRCYGIDDVFHKPPEERTLEFETEAGAEAAANGKDQKSKRREAKAATGEEKRAADGARLAGLPLSDWLNIMGASEDDLWDAAVRPNERLVWNARIFPATQSPDGYRDWLWMLEPAKAAPEMKAMWRKADRYSFADMLNLASQDDFHRRRLENRAEELRRSVRRVFRPESGFSASELASILGSLDQGKRREWVADILRLCGTFAGSRAGEQVGVQAEERAQEQVGERTSTQAGGRAGAGKFAPGLEQLQLARILHTLGSAVLKSLAEGDVTSSQSPEEPPVLSSSADSSSPSSSRATLFSSSPGGRRSGGGGDSPSLVLPSPPSSPAAGEGTEFIKDAYAALSEAYKALHDSEREALAAIGLPAELAADGRGWALVACEKAFDHIGRTIVLSREKFPDFPRNALRTDEIIWGRAPVRLDLGGGWSDTPPYSLEHGGCVINAAVNLNGQPPIHAYARVIKEPEIRISSIDYGARLRVRELDELLDYRSPESEFGLAKAALALSGFSTEYAEWPASAGTLKDMLLLFGGGIELTTLAAIPSGSGLGTSSIMGAVLMAVVHRMAGRSLTSRQLFHNVLRLEQELTTGGGWQDQIGGVLGGVKMIATEPGLVPDPRISYVPDEVLNPRANGGQTLLYYTGLRRLAKNILHYVVGNYLNRERPAMDTLRQLHSFPPMMVEAMAGKDIKRFGELIDVAWNLNLAIDPDSTTKEIEAILDRIRPHMHGAKLLGAGGGGFLLILAKSPTDAEAIRAELEAHPPNDRARFFGFDVSSEGLAVTTC